MLRKTLHYIKYSLILRKEFAQLQKEKNLKILKKIVLLSNH